MKISKNILFLIIRISNLKELKNIINLNDIKKYDFISKFSNKLIDLLQKGNFKTIIKHTKVVDHIKILPDGKLLSCSEDGTINIYNKQNYQLQQKINVSSGVVYIESLTNNNIISCCFDGKLRIYELKGDSSKLIRQLEGHTNIALKVILIENKNLLISCSRDKTMKIWKKDKKDDYNYNCIKSLIIGDKNNDTNTNILKINENKLVSSSCNCNFIKFFDMKNDFKEITTINNISINWGWNSMIIFKENILIIGGIENKGIYLIDTNSYKIVSNILEDFNIYSVIKLINGNILIDCNYNNKNNSLIEFQYDNNELIKIKSKEFAHSNAIVGLFEMEENIIISSSGDCSIKFWVL